MRIFEILSQALILALAVTGVFLSEKSWAAQGDPAETVARRLGLKYEIKGEPLAFPGVHRIYSDATLRRAILILDRLQGKKEPRIEEKSGYLLVEYPSSDHTYVSLAAVGIRREEWLAHASVDSGYRSKALEPPMPLISWFIPSAHADPCSTSRSKIDSFESILSHIETSHWATAYSCAVGILKGAWDSTGGLVESAANGLWTLGTDPSKFWEGAVESFNQLKKLIVNIDTEFKKILKNFAQIPDEVRAELLCSFIGGIGTDALIAALSMGAMSPKIIVSLTQYTRRLLKVEKLLSSLSVGTRFRKPPKKFYELLVTDKIPEADLNTIETLSKHGFIDDSMQVIECAL